MKGAAVAVGLLLDRLLGEPSASPHPVAVLGETLRRIEDRIYAPTQPHGALLAAAGVGLGVAAGGLATLILGRRTALILSTYLATSGRALDDAAATVERALARGDLASARREVRALVGRDVSEADEQDIARAVVESVAENTVDAVVAPVFWAVAAGAPGVLAHRAVNTLDSQVGYRNERYGAFGWASARLDDAAAWIPARITAALVIGARPSRAAAVLNAVRSDAPRHSSPNAGVAEASFAAALGLQLGGTNVYQGSTETRPALGTGRRPEPSDIAPARRLARDVAGLLGVALVVPGVVRGLLTHRTPR